MCSSPESEFECICWRGNAMTVRNWAHHRQLRGGSHGQSALELCELPTGFYLTGFNGFQHSLGTKLLPHGSFQDGVETSVNSTWDPCMYMHGKVLGRVHAYLETGARGVISIWLWTFASFRVLHVKMHTDILFYGAKFCGWTCCQGVPWQDRVWQQGWACITICLYPHCQFHCCRPRAVWTVWPWNHRIIDSEQ